MPQGPAVGNFVEVGSGLFKAGENMGTFKLQAMLPSDIPPTACRGIPGSKQFLHVQQSLGQTVFCPSFMVIYTWLGSVVCRVGSSNRAG